MPIVAALYQFTRLADPAALRAPLLALCEAQGIRGTLLLAPEGINGTLAGEREGIDTVQTHIRALPGCAGLDWKESRARAMPFGRMKVRLKREIVTMGQPEVDPGSAVGRYVAPCDWNALIAASDVVVIDTRNDYETAIGTFEGAVDPQTRSFRDFPAWWQANAHRFEGKRIAMFCTGGIRCEKASAHLLKEGFEEVYHLQGGILKYLQETKPEESLWEGECFVFDNRVAVDHDLQKGSYDQCHACRMPITEQEKQKPEYLEGVSCHHCIDKVTDEQRARFAERQKQIELAQARGEGHIGNEAQTVLQQRKEAKKAQKDAQRGK